MLTFQNVKFEMSDLLIGLEIFKDTSQFFFQTRVDYLEKVYYGLQNSTQPITPTYQQSKNFPG